MNGEVANLEGRDEESGTIYSVRCLPFRIIWAREVYYYLHVPQIGCPSKARIRQFIFVRLSVTPSIKFNT